LPDVESAALANPEGWSRYYQANVDPQAVFGRAEALAEQPGVAFGQHFDEQAGRATHEGFFIRGIGLGRPRRRGAPLWRGIAAEEAARAIGAVSTRAATHPLGRHVAALYWRRYLNALAPAPGHADVRIVVRPTAIAQRVDVQQTVRGAPVVGGTYRLHVDGGLVYAVTGNPAGAAAMFDPGEPPPLDTNGAEKACVSIFAKDDLRFFEVQQVVFPLEDRAVWAYEVTFLDEEAAADVRAYLAADGFSLLLSHNIASALTGRARVYRINPLRTPDVEEVELDGLGPRPPDRLCGGAVDVQPSRPPPLQSMERVFLFEPRDREFDEAQVYYHLWNISSRFRQLLPAAVMGGSPLAPIRAIVHDPRVTGNALYMPTPKELWFGDGPGSRSMARSADIVYHEYAHAITDKLCQLGQTAADGGQAGGLSEGYSDYFACSTLDDPRFGDYALNDPEGARNCARSGLRFPQSFGGEVHATGEVWSSVLWAIRDEIGAADADDLVIASLEFLGPESSFEDGLAALVTADRKVFPAGDRIGRNEQLITAAFDARRP
jgi:hypothetical protein